MDTSAAIAFSRFGLGRRRDEPVPADSKAWLRAQLACPDTVPTEGLTSSADAMRELHAREQMRQHKVGDMPVKQKSNVVGVYLHELHTLEMAALLSNAVMTQNGYRERLVWFWFNHFTVAARNPRSNACVGPYIREAIRPHVTGKFSDMLLAVMRHPAMLAYLDNEKSFGPNSDFGQSRSRGLNENMARECLELHTVTPASGYTQTDVTNFAKILTGWSVDPNLSTPGFIFRARAHEPGEQPVMGRTWPAGEEGGVAILAWLANHPFTHRHLAEKLTRHFVADDPPPADVTRIEAVLRDTNGDLGATSAALIDLPGAWTPLTKMRAPMDYVVATMRAVGANPAMEPALPDMVGNLGQPIFKTPFPIGWPDRGTDWAGSEALLQRVDFAYQFSARVTDQEPATVAQNTLGPLLTADTVDAIRRAGSRRDGLTLFLSSPEFLRR